jgi:multimeric flavodoxin WrbA
MTTEELSSLREKIINDVPVKILVLTASQRKGGHTRYLGLQAQETAQQVPNVETRFIDLAEYKINPCRSCEDKNGSRFCVPIVDGEPNFAHCPATKSNGDGMLDIWDALMWCDGMVIGSPVYFSNVSGILKNVMDRTVSTKTRKFWMRDKVGGAFAVAAHTYGGQEMTIAAIENYFRFHGMIIVADGAPTDEDLERLGSTHAPGSHQSVIWDRTHFCAGTADPTRGAIQYDEIAISNVRALGKRVALVTKAIKAAKQPFEMKIYPHFAKSVNK